MSSSLKPLYDCALTALSSEPSPPCGLIVRATAYALRFRISWRNWRQHGTERTTSAEGARSLSLCCSLLCDCGLCRDSVRGWPTSPLCMLKCARWP